MGFYFVSALLDWGLIRSDHETKKTEYGKQFKCMVKITF